MIADAIQKLQNTKHLLNPAQIFGIAVERTLEDLKLTANITHLKSSTYVEFQKESQLKKFTSYLVAHSVSNEVVEFEFGVFVNPQFLN
jgi:hypothetical protein